MSPSFLVNPPSSPMTVKTARSTIETRKVNDLS